MSGRVQGVGFRYATCLEARRLGVSGYVVNLPDGRVEVLACGTHEAINELLAWLETGPPAARVDEVAVTEVEAVAEAQTAGFEIRSASHG